MMLKLILGVTIIVMRNFSLIGGSSIVLIYLTYYFPPDSTMYNMITMLNLHMLLSFYS
jgi:hypothetical protein